MTVLPITASVGCGVGLAVKDFFAMKEAGEVFFRERNVFFFYYFFLNFEEVYLKNLEKIDIFGTTGFTETYNKILKKVFRRKGRLNTFSSNNFSYLQLCSTKKVYVFTTVFYKETLVGTTPSSLALEKNRNRNIEWYFPHVKMWFLR